jgi:hypothetical protein
LSSAPISSAAFRRSRTITAAAIVRHFSISKCIQINTAGASAAGRIALRIALLASPLALVSAPAGAHAFGARYDLPLPLDYYLAGAGAAVALSFVVMAVFAAYRRAAPLRTAWVVWPDPDASPIWRGFRLFLRALGIAVFLLIVAAGLFGVAAATKNIAPLLVWVVWWVGFLLLCAFVGNLWPALDPWTSFHDLAARGRPATPRRRWPERLSGWPAVLLFLVFAWAELVGPFGEDPRALALAIMAYSALTWTGMAAFGRAAWHRNADPFRRVFALIGSFAIFGRARSLPGRPLVIRLPAAGLLERRTERLADVAFVMTLLATVTFDGFSETPLWASFLDWIARDPTLRPLLLGVAAAGIDILGAIKTLALIAAPLIAFAVYTLFCALTALADRGVTTGQAMRAFALSLLPIAIAYHLSHYISYLLLAGQFVIPMSSDPFGVGWNLFGTTGYVMNMGIIGARAVWYLAIAALVTGHIASVVLAHSIAMRLFATVRAASISQIPFLVLMVAFTACSLWILAQPVVNEPAMSGG